MNPTPSDNPFQSPASETLTPIAPDRPIVAAGTLTRGDLEQAFNLQKTSIESFVGAAAILMCVAILLLVPFDIPHRAYWILAMLVASVFVVFGLMRGARKLWLLIAVLRSDDLPSSSDAPWRQQATIAPTGIRVESPKLTGDYAWSQIALAGASQEIIVLTLLGSHRLLLPQRHFASPDEFWTTLQRIQLQLMDPNTKQEEPAGFSRMFSVTQAVPKRASPQETEARTIIATGEFQVKDYDAMLKTLSGKAGVDPLVFFLFLGIGVGIAVASKNIWELLAVLGGAVVIGTAIVVWRVRQRRNQQARNESRVRLASHPMPMTITFTEHDIHIETSESDERYLWSQVARYELNRELIVLVLRTSVVVGIPARFFESPQAFQETQAWIVPQIASLSTSAPGSASDGANR